MGPSTTFPDHLRTLQERYEESLELLAGEPIRIDAVFLHSGSPATYFADDEEIIFRGHAHFRHWVPVHHPHQAVLVRPGERPALFRVRESSFWSDPDIALDDGWMEAFEVVEVEKRDDVIDALPPVRRIAFIGEDTAYASRLGLPDHLHNEKHLRNRLDYHRSLKTPYEIDRILAANRVALRGHRAAAVAFEAGGSEFDIYRAYLDGCGMTEEEQPFRGIVGLDEKSAILHYQHKRRDPGHDARLLIVDAGYQQDGYASDITRTYLRGNAHPVFHELLKRVTQIRDTIAQKARSGISFKDLNDETHRMVTRALLDTGVAGGEEEELAEKKVSALFLPHGLGHLLGLQVHDVGGLFKDETGVLAAPPEEHKNLRLTRTLEDTMVYTIEPGIYFIPMLLDAERETEKGAFLDFKLIKELVPLGGVRMEDNVVIQGDQPVNLTAKAEEENRAGK